MLKLVNKNVSTSLHEIEQPSPLRWKILHRDGNELYDVSSWIKCRDYFNDVVWRSNGGAAFSIYGFNCDFKYNDEGTYFLLGGTPVCFASV